jgi:nucleotide-binding universal stress UspA family protein
VFRNAHRFRKAPIKEPGNSDMANLDTSTRRALPLHDVRCGAVAFARPLGSEMVRAPVSKSQFSEAALHRHRILICLDGSPSSEVCVPYAVSIAKTFGSSITLVYVMHAHHERAELQTNDPLGWEISRQRARAYLERFERQISTAVGRPVDVRLEQGRPDERIVDLARELAVDLSVLGSHGVGGPAGTLGGTVQRVLAAGRGSVFVAHSSTIAPTVIAPKCILVPLDGSLRSESVLPIASRIASAHGAEILLVHVVQERFPTEGLRTAEDMELARQLAVRLELGAKRYLEHVQKHLGHEGTSVRALVVRHANDRHCLLGISQEEKVDLIVLSAHGSTCDAAESFGSVTASLLTRSRVPLLVIQDLPDRNARQVRDVGATLAPPSPRTWLAETGFQQVI